MSKLVYVGIDVTGGAMPRWTTAAYTTPEERRPICSGNFYMGRDTTMSIELPSPRRHSPLAGIWVWTRTPHKGERASIRFYTQIVPR